jgi:hypothetical protein
MEEKLPAPCEHCSATGIFHGMECAECRGKGYRLMVGGRLKPAPRPPNPNFSTGRRRTP